MAVEKVCSHCRKVFPIENFYNNKRLADGKDLYCKSCRNETKRKYETKYRDTLALYYRTWRESTKGGYNKYRAKWNAKNPLKMKAHKMVANALRDGRLYKLPCETCGKERVDAHHDDYSAPLVVKWLCRIHHKARHKVMGN